jgi:antitoxin component YwqK of YwqJK toxin-antitoxin module
MRFRLRTLLAASTVIALAAAGPRLYEYVPGSFWIDRNGFPHGTGIAHYFYKSGALMCEDHYFAGDPTRFIWYRPDGAVIADVTVPKKSEPFVGYYLYENGNVRVKLTYRYSDEENLWMADGRCERFDQDGKLISIERYEDGVLVSP